MAITLKNLQVIFFFFILFSGVEKFDMAGHISSSQQQTIELFQDVGSSWFLFHNPVRPIPFIFK
jgi:hypothetical protein